MKNPLYYVSTSSNDLGYDIVNREGGELMTEVEDFEAASAIAVLASKGHLQRCDTGEIFITPEANDPEEVQTEEEFMGDLDDAASTDDGPNDDDIEVDGCPIPVDEEIENVG